jgi:CheY-like chemotaxis protein
MSTVNLLRGRSAIVADDSATAREIVATASQSVQLLDIRQAANGVAALEMISKRLPDFVLLDIEMPHDGITVLRQIRGMPQHPGKSTPVMIMTAHADVKHITAARDAGANGFITKPLSLDRVVSRVAAMLGQPRPFVETNGYVGPDRRQRAKLGYAGPFRRAADAGQTEVLI